MNTVHTDDREIIVNGTEKCDEWKGQNHFVFTARELIERTAAYDGVGYNTVKKLGRNIKEDGKAVTITIRNYQEREEQQLIMLHVWVISAAAWKETKVPVIKEEIHFA